MINNWNKPKTGCISVTFQIANDKEKNFNILEEKANTYKEMRLSLTPPFSSATKNEQGNVFKGLKKMTVNIQIATQPNYQERGQNKDIFRYVKTQEVFTHVLQKKHIQRRIAE